MYKGISWIRTSRSTTAGRSGEPGSMRQGVALGGRVRGSAGVG
ncbi:hypothetical protein SSCG_01622 [Streptomyces clavuligerus]|nr:hypothetical protein SSCG_01622 [Streptomyces clavuligerus]